MKKDLLKEILNKIESVKVAVIGDFCLDAYWFVEESESEISVETGLATMPVGIQKYTPGGAGNVTNNLAALGIKEILAFGVIGHDPFAPKMIEVLRSSGVITENLLIQDKDWSTHVYIKPYTGDKEHNRIDFGNLNKLSDPTAKELLDNLKNTIKDVDIIIINQQVPSGIHTEYLRKNLVSLIKDFPDKIFIVDSRHYTDYYDGAYRKINDIEASLLCGINRKTEDTVPYSDTKVTAETLFKRYGKPLFITRGSRGSLIADQSGITDFPGLMILSKVDTVGAGDSYLAGVAATLAAGYPMGIAAAMGTFVAGVTVQKLFQTGTASPAEILMIGSDADYIYNPELADDIRQAEYHNQTEIEIINSWPDKTQIKHAIFDHDGTISTLREGWEEIMAPMMIKAILGDRYEEADEDLFHRAEERVKDFIDKTTGIQTLMQMKILLNVIEEFACVPKEKMLDEFAYKKIYNDDLIAMVHKRELKLKRGELSVEDVTIKGVIPFLNRLHEAGIKLYLASGTDEEDVIKEATLLGYAGLFEGRIFGAVGDIKKDAKKIVLNRILETIGDSGSGAIVTFGDGPVEIRETHKIGGLTAGIASNEQKRYGLNHTKRNRLVKAGADIIVPDFSQSPEILRLLNISNNS